MENKPDLYAVLIYDGDGRRIAGIWGKTKSQAIEIMGDPQYLGYKLYLHPDRLELAPPQVYRPYVKPVKKPAQPKATRKRS